MAKAPPKASKAFPLSTSSCRMCSKRSSNDAAPRNCLLWQTAFPAPELERATQPRRCSWDSSVHVSELVSRQVGAGMAIPSWITPSPSRHLLQVRQDSGQHFSQFIHTGILVPENRETEIKAPPNTARQKLPSILPKAGETRNIWQACAQLTLVQRYRTFQPTAQSHPSEQDCRGAVGLWAVRLLRVDGARIAGSAVCWARAQVRKLVPALSISEGFTHASVTGECPRCPLGSLHLFPSPLLLKATSHCTWTGSPSWLELGATSDQAAVRPTSHRDQQGALTQRGTGALLPAGLGHPHGTRQNAE